MSKKKKKVIFVGSFRDSAKDGSVGGQMFACKTLIESNISDQVSWLLIDSTADSNIPASFGNRLRKAIQRMGLFLRHLCFSQVDEVLIFTADGFSFVEKGSMSLLAKCFGKRVTLAPRSGFLERDLRTSDFLKRFIPFVFKQVDVVICQGKSWQQLFASYLPVSQHEKLVVIQNWLDIKKYAPGMKEPLVNKPLTVLFLSWVVKEKGIYDLIYAASKVKDSNLQFKIAGDGADLGSCKALCSELGLDHQFEFLGWVTGEGKIDLLANTDIYVLPSYFEGFPNSLLEAMACGKAVISTKVGSIPDLINNGSNGILIEAGDQNALAKALDKLNANHSLRVSIAENARKTVEKNNSIESAISAFQDVLNLQPCVE